MMHNTLPLLLLAFTTALAAPSFNDDYEEMIPQKRAALVLDRLLVALHKALREDSGTKRYEPPEIEGPRTAPLRYASEDNDMSSLERRGQPPNNRGRVLRCYFNAVTCF